MEGYATTTNECSSLRLHDGVSKDQGFKKESFVSGFSLN
jgi:hypothetical protein